MAKKEKQKLVPVQVRLEEEVYIEAKTALVARRESWQTVLTKLIKREFKIK